MTGTIGKTFKTTVSEKGISFKGSLAKYHLGSNIYTLTLQDSVQALEHLTDELRVPIREANVSRIDVAQNFLMDHPPQVYYSYLGDSRYYDRLSQPTSIRWQGKDRVKTIYDKLAEMKSRRSEIPQPVAGRHVLRYEMRYTSRICSKLNKPRITAGLLTDELFYRELIDKWKREYDSIDKIKRIRMNYSKIDSVRDLMGQAAALWFQNQGHEVVQSMLNEMKAVGVFTRPEYFSRFKRWIRHILNDEDLQDPGQLIDELTEKIHLFG